MPRSKVQSCSRVCLGLATKGLNARFKNNNRVCDISCENVFANNVISPRRGRAHNAKGNTLEYVGMLLPKPRPFVQSFFVLRYACVPTAARVSSFFFSFFFFFEDVAFPSVFVPLPFSFCKESTSSVSLFRVVFFYLVTMGWSFDIRLYDNSINYKNNTSATCPYMYANSKNMDQPGKVANPARGQLNRKNKYFPVCVRA